MRQKAAEGGPQREAQRSGFALERRSDAVSELCPPGRSEGYEIRDDEATRAFAAKENLRIGGSRKRGSGGRLPLSGGDVERSETEGVG